jgi:hypothetical protein
MIASEIILLEACLLIRNIFQISPKENPLDKASKKMTKGANIKGEKIPISKP